jgi:hypothetical protein
MFTVSKEEFELSLQKVFEEYKEFNVCLLSYNMVDSSEIEGYSQIRKVKKAHTTSGYIVNENYYDILIDLFKDAVPKLLETRQHWIYSIDQIWCNLQEKDNWIYIDPRIGRQRPGYSDNAYCFVDCNC